MSNNVTSGNSKFKYSWNPFNDIAANVIEKELVHCEGPGQPIITPRCFPFFAKGIQVYLKGSSTPLSLENGDYSFVYPYMTFLTTYQNLVYGGILLKGVSNPSDYYVTYSTIGSDYVLNDVNFAQYVANIVSNERTASMEQIVNFPAEFPPDPHDHPIKDTVGYLEMILWMKSYIDALVGIDTSLTLAKQFQAHIDSPLNKAHKADLSMVGGDKLENFPPADSETIKGESSEVYATVWSVKQLVRGFFNGDWK